MLKPKHSQSGFTVVELLVVIVVIAILAAISIVSYTGVQSKAYSSKAVSITNSYIKLLEMYKTEHGEYPAIDDTPDDVACFGTESNYPARDGMADGVCASDGRPTSEQLNTALKVYTGSLPSGELPLVNLTEFDIRFRGVFYERYTPSYVAIGYALKGGGGKCPIGDTLSASAATLCYVELR